jgi:hypothetical protein
MSHVRSEVPPESWATSAAVTTRSESTSTPVVSVSKPSRMPSVHVAICLSLTDASPPGRLAYVHCGRDRGHKAGSLHM